MTVLHCKYCGHLKHGRKFSMAALNQNKPGFSTNFLLNLLFQKEIWRPKVLKTYMRDVRIDLQKRQPIQRLYRQKIPSQTR